MQIHLINHSLLIVINSFSFSEKIVSPTQKSDRIEIYRPLITDPNEVRRRRAEKAKDEGKANKMTGGRAKV